MGLYTRQGWRYNERFIVIASHWRYNALETYDELERKKRKLINKDCRISSSDNFLPTLKRIISFHSYSETDRKNIEQAIKTLCQQYLDLHEASTTYNNNNTSQFNIHNVNNTIGLD